jgi:putative peptidoglycan lipid II flippase
MKLTGPRLLGFSLGRANLIIDRIFASGLGVGYVSCLTYAYRVFQIPSAILLSTFAKTFMPLISEHAAAGNREEIGKLISKAIRLVAFVTVPFAVALFMLRAPLIQLLFERGAFDARATELTSTVFLFYDLGLVAFCCNIILLGAFYASQDASTPLKVSLINAVLNVVLDVILIKWFGLGGIALATSIIAVFNTIFLLTYFQKKFGTLESKKTFTSLLRICWAAGIMALVVWSITNNFGDVAIFRSQVLQIGTFAIISIVTYAVACMIFRVNEFRRVLIFCRKKISF